MRITACAILLLSFTATAATLMTWPLITKHLPREARKAIEEIQQ